MSFSLNRIEHSIKVGYKKQVICLILFFLTSNYILHTTSILLIFIIFFIDFKNKFLKEIYMSINQL